MLSLLIQHSEDKDFFKNHVGNIFGSAIGPFTEANPIGDVGFLKSLINESINQFGAEESLNKLIEFAPGFCNPRSYDTLELGVFFLNFLYVFKKFLPNEQIIEIFQKNEYFSLGDPYHFSEIGLFKVVKYAGSQNQELYDHALDVLEY